jgi:hypothetical protein
VADLDTDAWIERARRYGLLRRVFWCCILAMLALVALGSLIHLIRDRLHPTVRAVYLTISALVWSACGLAAVAAWLALKFFRCPKCGKRFASAWWGGFGALNDRCLHCSFDFGPAAKSTR